MNKSNTLLAAAASLALGAAPAIAQDKTGEPVKSVVLVHGGFVDGSGWMDVYKILKKDGYKVSIVQNPTTTLADDVAVTKRAIAAADGNVVLVGHSYGGPVISEAAYGNANVKALVYVAALAPEAGETVAGLAGRFPGSTLGPTLAAPVALQDGGKDLYIQQDKFHDQFAADVPNAAAQLMAATQRPVTEAALNEAAGEPEWKSIPSWFVYGDQDKNIPPQAMAFMAQRAHARQTVVVKGASHVVMVSNPKTVAHLIESAARSQ